jgi:hypothetical protein
LTLDDFWNIRYSDSVYAYGTEPNEYLKKMIDVLEASSILLPGEGEGRNAVYCAKKGWQVDAFDSSEQAKIKAIKLAQLSNVNINYTVYNTNDFTSNQKYGVLALIFTRFGKTENNLIYPKLAEMVIKGGYIIFECFSVRQSKFHHISGGPEDIKMLFTKDDIYKLFPDYDVIDLDEREIVLDEGKFHVGKGSVINFFGQKR